MGRRITGGEWAWVALASILIMALFSAPYVVGYYSAPPGTTFSGFLFGLEDAYSYLAKMRYGARDGWLFQLVYTTEPHRGGFVFAFYLALGKLAALVSGQGAMVSAQTLVAVYHAARIVLGLLYLAVLYRFAAQYLEEPPQRRLAWALAALAGGLGWGLLIAGLAQGTETRLPVEFYVPEGFSVLLLYGLPHLSLARALLLAGWLLLFRGLDEDRWTHALAAGVAWLGMGIMVPFYEALLGMLIAAWLAGVWIAQRRFPWVELQRAALAGVLPALFLAYNLWLFSSNPVFAAWSAQNILPSPPVIDFVLAYGLLGVLAIPGAIRFWREGLSTRRVLLIAWPIAAAAMVYLPIAVQRRLLEGVIVPLCILATSGIGALVGRKPAGGDESPPDLATSGGEVVWRLRQVAAAALLVLLFPSTVLLIAGGTFTALTPRWPMFHTADELAALNWLRLHAPPGSVVLSTNESGNLIPAFAGVRSYVGHGPETINGNVKQIRAEAFFRGGMTDAERRALLDEVGVTHIWIGPPERREACEPDSCLDPASLGLREVFHGGDYVVYEVSR